MCNVAHVVDCKMRGWLQFGWLVVGISGITCYAVLKVWGRGKQRERDEGYLGPDRTDKK